MRNCYSLTFSAQHFFQQTLYQLLVSFFPIDCSFEYHDHFLNSQFKLYIFQISFFLCDDTSDFSDIAFYAEIIKGSKTTEESAICVFLKERKHHSQGRAWRALLPQNWKRGASVVRNGLSSQCLLLLVFDVGPGPPIPRACNNGDPSDDIPGLLLKLPDDLLNVFLFVVMHPGGLEIEVAALLQIPFPRDSIDLEPAVLLIEFAAVAARVVDEDGVVVGRELCFGFLAGCACVHVVVRQQAPLGQLQGADRRLVQGRGRLERVSRVERRCGWLLEALFCQCLFQHRFFEYNTVLSDSQYYHQSPKMASPTSIVLLAICLLLPAFSWPSYGKGKSPHGHGHSAEPQINTAMVHNDCCQVPIVLPSGPNVTYPTTFTHEWNMYQVDNCYQNSSCPQPPYYPTPPPFASRNSPGKTYYDSRHRGGSQKEVYTERCIPIFPSYDPPAFTCDFYLVTEENKAFMTTKNAPGEFGDCCILAQPFHPPAQDFTRKMNFTGTKILAGQEYFEFSVFVEESGGPFVHGFWAKPTIDKVFPTAFFYMVGVNDKILYQEFNNYSTRPFDSEAVFKIPDSCRSPNIRMCPDFDFDAFKKHSNLKRF